MNAAMYGPPPNIQVAYGPPPVNTALNGVPESLTIFLLLLKWALIPIALIVGIWLYAKKKTFSKMKKWIIIAVVLVIYFVVLFLLDRFA